LFKDSVSKRYLGSLGIQYARGQQDVGYHLGFLLQSRLYEPHLLPSDTVLDFGCANGGITLLLKRNVREVYGLEVNDYTRAIAESQGLRVFKSLTEIPSSILFDKIVSNHVLEHIPRVCDTLVLLRKLLKPNGRLVVVLPIDDFRSGRNKSWMPNDKDNHLFTWTPLLFGNLLVEAGFSILKINILTTAWSPKLFFLGDTTLQRLANRILAIIGRSRQLIALAKPSLSEFGH
jgi:SAM-dependent methyltransferase